MFDISINEKFNFSLSETDADQLDIVSLHEGAYHIIHEGTSCQAELIEFDLAEKSMLLKIDGVFFQVKIRDHFDLLVKKMGLSANVIHKVKELKAPMPGLVLLIDVVPGQEVKEGDQLFILEAMKMENVIKSTGDGIVKEVFVKKGQAVDKGALLIEME